MFSELVNKARASKKLEPLADFKLLALDPGQTTGWSIWTHQDHQTELVRQGQASTWPMTDAVKSLNDLVGMAQRVEAKGPLLLVFEAYNVYAHKLQQHTHSDVPTLRVIGVIETLCTQAGVEYFTQTAQVAKAFSTDGNLKSWGYYQRGQRHARDSVRHGTYFIMFTKWAPNLDT